MDINIYLEGKKIDIDYKTAIAEYKKRLSSWCNLSIIQEKSIDKISTKKSAKTYVVCPGKDTISSTDLADLINTLNIQGFSCINFIVLPERCLKDTYSYLNSQDENTPRELFNLSSFTMCSDLTATVLSEQIYRAYTIMNNITYHK